MAELGRDPVVEALERVEAVDEGPPPLIVPETSLLAVERELC